MFSFKIIWCFKENATSKITFSNKALGDNLIPFDKEKRNLASKRS